MKKVIVYALLALMVIIGSYQLVSAKPGNGGGNGAGNGSCTPGSNRQPISYVEKLKLTEEQVSKIGILIKNDNTASLALHQKIQTNNNLLREMEWSKSFNQENADKLIKEIQDARTTMQTNHQNLFADIRALLTADQQKIYDELGGGCTGSGSCDGRGPGGKGGNGGRRGGCKKGN